MTSVGYARGTLQLDGCCFAYACALKHHSGSKRLFDILGRSRNTEGCSFVIPLAELHVGMVGIGLADFHRAGDPHALASRDKNEINPAAGLAEAIDVPASQSITLAASA